jgi:hypothetical protein
MDLKVPHTWMGYEDVRNGLGFRSEYDSWNIVGQRNYELGRRRAVIFSLAGPIPYWPRDEYLKPIMERLPNTVQTMIAEDNIFHFS